DSCRMHQCGQQTMHLTQVIEARVNDVRVCFIEPSERSAIVQEEDEMRRRQRAGYERAIDLHAAKALGFERASLTTQRASRAFLLAAEQGGKSRWVIAWGFVVGHAHHECIACANGQAAHFPSF